MQGVRFRFTAVSADKKFLLAGYITALTGSPNPMPDNAALQRVERELAKVVRDPVIHSYEVDPNVRIPAFAITCTKEFHK